MSNMIEVSKNQLLVTRIAAAVLAVALLVVLFKLLNPPPPPPPVQRDGAAILDKEPIPIPDTLALHLRDRGFAVLMLVNAEGRIMPVATDGTPLISCGQLDGTALPDSCPARTRTDVGSNMVTISTFTGSECGDIDIFGTLFRDVHLDGRYAGKQPCHTSRTGHSSIQ